MGSVSFAYDELSRVASVQTAGTDCTLINGLTRDWGNAFVYDIWGNLYQKNQTKCSAEGLAETVNSKNQFNGYSYDLAGNLLNDGLGISFTYDAENRLKTSGGATTYTYDGDGNRVAKSGYRLYWWGMNGNGGPLAETFTSGGNKREYIYFAGRRIAMVDLSVSGNNCQGTPPNCARYYFYPDQVGSTAVLASSSGNTTVHEADFYPFGGERIITSSSIDPHYRFTGKERDDESNLDYFGARYHGSRLARFMSPDEPFADQHEDDPQSWNLYAYVRNNPVNNIDPDGRGCVTGNDGSGVDVPTMPGESCAEIEEKRKTDAPNAVVTAFTDPAELLSYHLSEMFRPHSVAEFVSEAGRSTLAVTAPLASGAIDCAVEGCDVLQATIGLVPIPGKGGVAALGLRADVARRVNGVLKQVQAGTTKGKPYHNFDGKLPKGSYREYTVSNPRVPGRGAERVVIEQTSGATYYTPDHYTSFVRIK